MLGRVGGDFGRMGLVRPAGHLAGASLDLNFVASSGYPAAPSLLLTTTRSSSGDYADNSAGNWSLFASNVPRITDKGLLVEEARTNSIRNNSMQGAVAGTPGTPPTNWSISSGGGVTRTIVGTGTENGVDYIDVRLQAASGLTSVIVFEGATQIAALSGQVWSASVFAKIIAGALTNLTPLLTMQEKDAGGGFLAQSDFSLGALSSTLTRFSGSRTFNNVSTAFTQSYVNLVASGAFDITLRIGWPQLELGASATSPIRTTVAAATRAADAVSVTSPPALSLTAGTIFGEGMLPVAVAASTFPVLVDINDGSAANFLRLSSNSLLNHRVGLTSGSVSQGDYNAGGAIVVGTPSKWAMAYALNDVASAYNGTAGATDASATMPVTLTGITIGRYPFGNPWNGYIRRVAYFPTRLTNAQLQALTQ